MLAAEPYRPAEQLLHDVAPDSENVPAGHVPVQLATDTFVVDPYRPAEQLLHTVEPDSENVPGGHAPLHVPDVSAGDWPTKPAKHG
jgi:hypothetical protein